MKYLSRTIRNKNLEVWEVVSEEINEETQIVIWEDAHQVNTLVITTLSEDEMNQEYQLLKQIKELTTDLLEKKSHQMKFIYNNKNLNLNCILSNFGLAPIKKQAEFQL